MSRHARFCALSSLLVIIGVLPYTAFAGTIPNFTPGYAFDWNPVAEGGVYDFSLGGAGNHAAQYTWPGGRAIGILYKGTFQGGATPVSSHFLGSSGSTLEFSDYFASHDDYFVVVYHLPFFADPDWHASVDACCGTVLLHLVHFLLIVGELCAFALACRLLRRASLL